MLITDYSGVFTEQDCVCIIAWATDRSRLTDMEAHLLVTEHARLTIYAAIRRNLSYGACWEFFAIFNADTGQPRRQFRLFEFERDGAQEYLDTEGLIQNYKQRWEDALMASPLATLFRSQSIVKKVNPNQTDVIY